MIVNAIVKKANIDKTQSRLELFSPKFKEGKPLAHLASSYEGKIVKFITEWDDIVNNKHPFHINGGVIDSDLIGKSTLTRGMTIQCTGDDTIYVVMDPVLIK